MTSEQAPGLGERREWGRPRRAPLGDPSSARPWRPRGQTFFPRITIQEGRMVLSRPLEGLKCGPRFQRGSSLQSVRSWGAHSRRPAWRRKAQEPGCALHSRERSPGLRAHAVTPPQAARAPWVQLGSGVGGRPLTRGGGAAVGWEKLKFKLLR